MRLLMSRIDNRLVDSEVFGAWISVHVETSVCHLDADGYILLFTSILSVIR